MRRIALFLVLAGFGCRKTEAPAPPPPARAEPPALTIADVLQREAAARPEGARRAEDVFAALRDGGLDLEAVRQYVARTVSASYCAGSRTAAGLAVAVCEYADAAAAARGKAVMEARFPMRNREIVVRGRNTVTLTRGPGSDEDARRARRLLEAAL